MKKKTIQYCLKIARGLHFRALLFCYRHPIKGNMTCPPAGIAHRHPIRDHP